MIRVFVVLVAAAIVSACAQPSTGGSQSAPLAGLSATAPTEVTVSVPLNFRTHLNGRSEVPVRETLAQGQAIFQLDKAGTTMFYRLIASNITNVTQAHIHLGPADGTGNIVVWLYPSTSPPAAAAGAGRHDGVLAAGQFTASHLINDLAGQDLEALLTQIRNGNAYVNVHTNDGVAPANTGPGDFPGGEIRGQL